MGMDYLKRAADKECAEAAETLKIIYAKGLNGQKEVLSQAAKYATLASYYNKNDDLRWK